ncbi:MAG: hypothetical protein ACQEQU_07405 [Spirochaetota bacterium]
MEVKETQLMEETRTRIAECKQACTDIDAKLLKQYELFGEIVYSQVPDDEEHSLQEFRQEADEKRKVLTDIEKDIRDIQQAQEAADTAREEISRIEQRLASVEFEKNSLYSRIGVITYEEYAAGQVGEEFSLLFTSITHQNAELSRVQKQLKENELKYVAASFFEKMSLRMKRNKIKAELEKLEAAREDLFRNAGKQICNSELIHHVKSKNAHAISEDFKRLDKERDRLYALLESKRFDYNKSQDILDQSGADSDAAKKVKELEKRKAQAEQELNQVYGQIGKQAAQMRYYTDSLSERQDASAALEQVEALLEERQTFEKELEQLEAQTKIRELSSAIDVDRQKQERVRSQITALNGQLTEIEQRIEQMKAQIEELRTTLPKNATGDRITDEQQLQ